MNITVLALLITPLIASDGPIILLDMLESQHKLHHTT